MTRQRLTRRQREETQAELRKQWPRIGFAVTVHESGYVCADYFLVRGRMEYRGVQGVERAEIWEELARFYEWQLEQRSDEIAHDPTMRYLLTTWMDSMAYSLRRSAAYARGEDPGPVIPQPQRIPEVFAELHARIYGDDEDRRAVDRAERNGRVVELAGKPIAGVA